MKPDKEKRCLVILNPAAKSERAGKVWHRVFRDVVGVEMAFTRAVGHARELACKAAADGYPLVVAAGGDGTINEVVNGIAGSESTLGILPLGSVNVLARELGLPRSLKKAWKVITEGECRRIDLGKITTFFAHQPQSRYFSQLAGVGFVAKAVQHVTQAQKRVWGPLSYVFAGFRVAAENPPLIRLEVEGEEPVEGRCAILGNGRFYGGPFAILKRAKIDDGLLDICLFENGGYLNIFRYLQAIGFGTHTELKDVRYLKIKKIKITSTNEVPVEVDGEMLGFLPIEVEVIPRALKVMTPHS